MAEIDTKIDDAALKNLMTAAQSRSTVTGLTHNFYRYPARFSPLFARAAISAFTEPGDLVLDPFMGGGTTLVEASVLGRRAVGCDISSLSVFLSRTKTTPLSDEDIASINLWAKNLSAHLNMRNTAERATNWATLGYQNNINSRQTWRIRKTLELALARIHELPTLVQQQFARCIILRTAQWALDCRKNIPSVGEFRTQFYEYLSEMSVCMREYSVNVQTANERFNSSEILQPVCIHASATQLADNPEMQQYGTPKLILTSPPYPGVHVVYHRWQIHGRKETPAPFWIADSLDGNGGAYYTFGDRRQQGLKTYFHQVKKVFTSLRRLAGQDTIVVQLVAFSDPSWQLDQYLAIMSETGFEELVISNLIDSPDGRLWRDVPNRKWYATQKGLTHGAKELLLLHRPSQVSKGHYTSRSLTNSSANGFVSKTQ